MDSACQVPLPFTLSQGLLKFMSEILPNHLILHCSLLRLQSFPASGCFPTSQFFASGGQSIRNSASASVFPMNIQGWFPLGLTDLISLLFKGLLGVFPSTTVGKHQFFSTQSFSWSNSHICTWLLEKPQLWLDARWTFVSKVVSLLFDMSSSFASLSFQGIRNIMAAVTILRGSWSWEFLEGQSE